MDDRVKCYTVFAPFCKKSVELVLEKDRISFVEAGGDRKSFASLDDVLGLRVDDGRHSNYPTIHCKAEICTFSRDEAMSKPKRRLKYTVVIFDDGDSFQVNRESALDCKECLKNLCLKHDRVSLMGDQSNSMGESAQPRFLVVINPFSGTKQGVKQYRKIVQPMFQLAGIEVVEELITERHNHAREFIQTFDFDRITGIISVGGDGTVFELVNGMMSRRDRDTVIKTPFGIIPTGSGNAVVASLLRQQCEEYGLLNAVYQIVRGGIQSIDLATATTSTESYYTFSALLWGLIADTDIESEKVRFLGGEIRDTLGALKCIIQKRSYHGRVSYLPLNTASVAATPAVAVNKEQYLANKESEENTGNSEQQQQQLKEDTDENSELAALPPSSSATSPTCPNDPVTPIDVTPTLTDPVGGVTPTPTLSDSVPDNWVTIEDDFISVMVGIAPMLSNKFTGDPEGALSNGKLYLSYVNGNHTRKELLISMTEMGENSVTRPSHATFVETQVCRVEPMTTEGRFALDGEEIEYSPIQIELNKSFNIFSRLKHN